MPSSPSHLSMASAPSLRRVASFGLACMCVAPWAVAQTKSTGNKPREPVRLSDSETLMDYRVDAASHLYRRYKERLYHGKMPPQLYAIGILEFSIDVDGTLTEANWIRAPSHAPEVMRAVMAFVKEASPYPAPTKLGKVTYMETWLWDKSGKWQIDILSEGQLDG